MLWIVAGSGPSLTESAGALARLTSQGQNNAGSIPAARSILAVNDAYRLFPEADALYAADVEWWQKHKGCPGFKGQRWTCTSSSSEYGIRMGLCKQYDIKIIKGSKGKSFSTDPNRVTYGGNSGFQAVNLAMLWGGNPIILIGFDMKGAGTHFFGRHEGLRNTKAHALEGWCRIFEVAAYKLPKNINIINATPDSALTCFPKMTIEEALNVASRNTG